MVNGVNGVNSFKITQPGPCMIEDRGPFLYLMQPALDERTDGRTVSTTKCRSWLVSQKQPKIMSYTLALTQNTVLIKGGHYLRKYGSPSHFNSLPCCSTLVNLMPRNVLQQIYTSCNYFSLYRGSPTYTKITKVGIAQFSL